MGAGTLSERFVEALLRFSLKARFCPEAVSEAGALLGGVRAMGTALLKARQPTGPLSGSRTCVLQGGSAQPLGQAQEGGGTPLCSPPHA